MTRDRPLLWMTVAATVFAFYLPTSINTVISRELSIVSIAGTCVCLLALLGLRGRTAPPALLAVSAALLGLLTLFTITSPFDGYAPGVVMLYVAIALLFALDLRVVAPPRLEIAFAAVVGITLAAGYALALNVRAADLIAYGYYNAFYPHLLFNMVVLNDKPVITFATHSVAGLMLYLLFYLEIKTYQVRGGIWRYAVALALLGLLVLLRSTTGMAFGAVAALQAAWALLRARPQRAAALAMVLSLVVLFGLISNDLGPATLYARAEEAIVGDRVRGLFARYAAEGLLASNFAYLSESPLSPIGFTVTETLYLGDSGVVVNLLRGSVPLLVAVYLGLFMFLRFNLRDRRTALWLWCVVVLFEIGFTPLQYFRFVAFVPFMIVYLNSLGPPASWPAGRAVPAV